MKSCDVVVAGGGSIGSAAALGFARAGWRVNWVAPSGCAPTPFGVSETEPRPDRRVYALSPASRRFLNGLGVWQRMSPGDIAPIHDMRLVHRRDAEAERSPRSGLTALFGSAHQACASWLGVEAPPLPTGVAGTGSSALAAEEIHLDAYGNRLPALAWIVEDRTLMAALNAALEEAGVVVSTTKVGGLQLPEPGAPRASAVVHLEDGHSIRAGLVVGADGSQSALRKMARVVARTPEVRHTALVAAFASSTPHRDCAWQWFSPDSVLAMLPLPHPREVSMVWSMPNRLAETVLSLPEESLIEQLQILMAGQFPDLTVRTPVASFPIQPVYCADPVRPGFVLVGDAAHAMHPMAGQGMNLGFGDLEALLTVVTGSGTHRSMAGSESVRPHFPDGPIHPESGASHVRAPDWLTLRRYARMRREPVLTMQSALEALDMAFTQCPRPLEPLRDLGWSMVARSPWLRGRLVRHAVS